MAFLITKPIADYIQEYTLQVNSIAGDKILLQYPFYLQHNISRDVNSLEAISMFAWIDSIRDLANTAKASIATATTIVDIRTAMTVYTDSLHLII